MFEAKRSEKSRLLWKVFPLAIVVFGIVVALAVYLSSRGPDLTAEVSGMMHEGDPYFDWYSQYVELRDPKLQMATNFAGGRMVIFSGIIDNDGERALDAVEIKLVFFNYDQPVYETARVPIRPEREARTPPIRPFQERGFTFYIEALPEGWGSNQAEMSISGFRFAGEAEGAALGRSFKVAARIQSQSPTPLSRATIVKERPGRTTQSFLLQFLWQA
ncbi:MAG: hypothetical protein ACRD1R_21095 [Acidobacteriota bacterium]